MNVVAIMIVRNEEACLPRCLEYLAEQGLRAAVIDNGSTDRTREILESFAPRVVIHIEDAPFSGTFEWRALLGQSDAMRRKLGADWFHLNSPDEIMSSNRPGERLIDAIARIDAAGYTAVNYDEFVFLPVGVNAPVEGRAFDKIIRHYYFFEPGKMRLLRTWKNIPEVTSAEGAGHALTGAELQVYPESFIMRHYIALSAGHFRAKYGGRKFPEHETERGWHFNRININVDEFSLPSRSRLKALDLNHPEDIDRSDPWAKHFWELPPEAAPSWWSRWKKTVFKKRAPK